MRSSTHSNKILGLTVPARRDLVEIGDYTEKTWGKRQMVKYIEKIEQKAHEILNMPSMGMNRSDLRKEMRAHPADQHVIYYYDTKEKLIIFRVLHKSIEPERYIEQDKGQS